MNPSCFKIRAKVWLYQGPAPWHFVTLPKTHAERIKARHRWRRRMKKGWGSLPVEVTVGKTVWSTSIFPDSKSGSYVLPLKEKVRTAEGIRAGKTLTFRLEIRA